MKRALHIIIAEFMVALAVYSAMLVNVHSTYYETAAWIQSASLLLFYSLPVLAILVFFKRMIPFVMYSLDVVFIATFVYGAWYVGIERMFDYNNYLMLTIFYFASILASAVMLVQNKKADIATK